MVIDKEVTVTLAALTCVSSALIKTGLLFFNIIVVYRCGADDKNHTDKPGLVPHKPAKMAASRRTIPHSSKFNSSNKGQSGMSVCNA